MHDRNIAAKLSYYFFKFAKKMPGIEFGIILANCITVDTRGTLNVSYSFGDSVQGHKYCIYGDNIIAVLRGRRGRQFNTQLIY